MRLEEHDTQVRKEDYACDESTGFAMPELVRSSNYGTFLVDFDYLDSHWWALWGFTKHGSDVASRFRYRRQENFGHVLYVRKKMDGSCLAMKMTRGN